LIFLKLQNNKIKSLSSTAFLNLPQLGDLDLSNNLLTSLPKDIFSGFRGWFTIWLHNNKLNAIFKTTISNLKTLSQITLKNNTCIDINIFSFSDFVKNSAAFDNAFAKCDANANNNCSNSNSDLKKQLKTAAIMLANASSILSSITSKL
jgi:hypothetical protein